MNYAIDAPIARSMANTAFQFERVPALRFLWRRIVLPVMIVITYVGAWWSAIFCELLVWIPFATSDVPNESRVYWAVSIVTLVGIVFILIYFATRLSTRFRSGVVALDPLMLFIGSLCALVIVLLLGPFFSVAN